MSYSNHQIVGNKKKPRFTPFQNIVIAILAIITCCSICSAVMLLGNIYASTIQENEIASADPDVGLPTGSPVSWTSTDLPRSLLEVTPIVNSESVGLLPVETESSTGIPTSTLSVETGDDLQVHFIDVGHGDATLIRSPEGHTILIDGGDTDSGVSLYLLNQGIDHIDLMIATHPHSDHIGGLISVLQTFPVYKVVTNGQSHSSSVYDEFWNEIQNEKADYVVMWSGDEISLGRLTFEVLSPEAIDGDDLNENSLVLRMIWGNTRILFAGDAGKEAEARILATGKLINADILKIGHHGNDSSSSPEFLTQVNPQYAVYFADSDEQSGNPGSETLSALAAIGAQVYGTDVNQNIVFTTNRQVISVAPAIGGPRKTAVVFVPTITTLPPTSLSLSITSLTSPIKPGAKATLKARTVPGAYCTITVYHKSGPATAQGLEPKTANGNGIVSWSWKVGSRTTPGTWRIVVTASINRQTVSKEVPFVVIK